MAQEKDPDINISSSEIGIRRIDIKDLWQALKEGLDDFNAKPSVYFFLCIFYPLFALFLTLFLIGENLLHLIFPMIAGFTLIGTVVSIGLFEISRRRELGLDVHWSSAFGFVHSSSFAGIAALSLVMMALYVAWLYMAQLIYFGLFGADAPVSIPDFVNQVLTTRRGGALIAYGTLVGFNFAVVALAISVVAFPMLLIPGKCLAILRAVWNFITFGFSRSPSIGVRRPGFRYKQNARPSAKLKATTRSPPLSMTSAITEREAHETS